MLSQIFWILLVLFLIAILIPILVLWAIATIIMFYNILGE